jgi:muramoyltetrapeptide carboxypeptidase LdcA involved in peptidoglycan recycling
MFPPKLKRGDEVVVIAPAQSLALPLISEEIKQIAIKRFEKLGLRIRFGKHVNEIDEFNSSSIESRIDDLHEAFGDDSIKCIISAIGGFNSNQLLRYLDYKLIKQHPKVLCGFSDITALANAIYAKTGLVTYIGPHFISFGEKKGFKYTLEYFKKCLFSSEPFEIKPSKKWSDDKWMKNQKNRKFYSNEGYWIINEGEAIGRIIGGNLSTLNLLQGTEFMPSLNGKIIFLEDDELSTPQIFDRDLQSLIHQPEFRKVKGLVIGRFQLKSKMTKYLLEKIIKTKKELNRIPVIANVDFGHTTPLITFPIGGKVRMLARSNRIKLEIIEH